MGLMGRVAGAPISWGVCEVPGWGRTLDADRVLAEMAAVGLRATELGAPGFLPDDPASLRATLDRFGLSLVGGFVPLVLHDPARTDDALARAAATATQLAQAGGRVFVTAAVVDEAWSPRTLLDDGQWDHLVGLLARLDDLVGEHGLIHVLHPHLGTLVETADDIARVATASDVGWCLDSGHLTLGGVDPIAFATDLADRIRHVHLKDVSAALAARVRSGDLSLLPAVREGLFCPLGHGDVAIADLVAALERSGYHGWYVLEQDTAITGDEPPAGSGPVNDVRQSVAYLRTVVAPRLDRVGTLTPEGGGTR